jgi:hypothetical protein
MLRDYTRVIGTIHFSDSPTTQELFVHSQELPQTAYVIPHWIDTSIPFLFQFDLYKSLTALGLC